MEFCGVYVPQEVVEVHILPRLGRLSWAALRLASKALAEIVPPPVRLRRLCACCARPGFDAHPDACLEAGHPTCITQSGRGMFFSYEEAQVIANGENPSLLAECELPAEARDRSGPWGRLAPPLAAQDNPRAYNRFLGLWGNQPVPEVDEFALSAALAGQGRGEVRIPPRLAERLAEVEVRPNGMPIYDFRADFAVTELGNEFILPVLYICRGGHEGGLESFRAACRTFAGAIPPWVNMEIVCNCRLSKWGAMFRRHSSTVVWDPRATEMLPFLRNVDMLLAFTLIGTKSDVFCGLDFTRGSLEINKIARYNDITAARSLRAEELERMGDRRIQRVLGQPSPFGTEARAHIETLVGTPGRRSPVPCAEF